tara:strand:+ start:4626 stop:5108 length:483 start_codon:yes stop_codon:yes gene_type:complete
MATSTLIQDLSSTSVACSARRKVETYWASAAITAGQWVTFDQTKTGVERSKYVKPADAGAAATTIAVGVAITAVTAAEATAGAVVEVVVAGYVENASANTAGGATVKVVAGTQMTIGTTAGMAVLLHEIAGAHTQGQAVGYALEDSVGATVDCIVTCSPS